MKKKTRINYILAFTILIVGFLFGFFAGDIYNKEKSYYQANFTVSDATKFDTELLLDEDFLIGVRDSNKNYENIDVHKMLKKDDFKYVQNNNDFTIITKYKYYDIFYLRKNYDVSTRAKMFIKTAITTIAKDKCDVVFEDSENIVKVVGSVNRWNVALTTLVLTLIAELIYLTFKKPQLEKQDDYDNQNVYKTCFHKSYWKSAFTPIKKVKDIATIAMLFAMMLLCKFIPIPSGFGNLGLSFTYLFFSAIALIYGPIVGFVVGIFSDIIGFFLPNSGGGTFNILYTLQAALCGFIYGLCFYKRKIKFSNALFARLLVNLLMNALMGSFLFTMIYLDDSMTLQEYVKISETYMLYFSLPKNIIYLLPQSIFLYYVLKLVMPIFVKFRLIDKKTIYKKEKLVKEKRTNRLILK